MLVGNSLLRFLFDRLAKLAVVSSVASASPNNAIAAGRGAAAAAAAGGSGGPEREEAAPIWVEAASAATSLFWLRILAPFGAVQ